MMSSRVASLAGKMQANYNPFPGSNASRPEICDSKVFSSE